MLFRSTGHGNPLPPDPQTRPLWQFKYKPEHYGQTFKAFFGESTQAVIITFNSKWRYDGPNGIVAKISGETGLLRIHDRFGSPALKCVIEFTV